MKRGTSQSKPICLLKKEAESIQSVVKNSLAGLSKIIPPTTVSKRSNSVFSKDEFKSRFTNVLDNSVSLVEPSPRLIIP